MVLEQGRILWFIGTHREPCFDNVGAARVLQGLMLFQVDHVSEATSSNTLSLIKEVLIGLSQHFVMFCGVAKGCRQ